MPEARELVSDVVAGVGATGNDGDGIVALADAAMPFCGGANL
jgi:hypothetical protein